MRMQFACGWPGLRPACCCGWLCGWGMACGCDWGMACGRGCGVCLAAR